jgi:hypothetical protein
VAIVLYNSHINNKPERRYTMIEEAQGFEEYEAYEEFEEEFNAPWADDDFDFFIE